jgi:uncharacterized protein YjbI with pentapeptide repeats
MNDALPVGTDFFQAWRVQLLALNPWARGLKIAEQDAEFRTTRSAAMITRYREGADVWNAWANKMLGLQQQLQTSGSGLRWAAEKRPAKIQFSGKNSQTREWLALATTSFDGHTFGEEDKFTSFVFPGATTFVGAKFPGVATFSGVVCHGGADFTSAEFSKNAWFSGATLGGGGIFYKAIFNERAVFDRVRWIPASWDKGAYRAVASFRRSHVVGRASFNRSVFEGRAFFGEAEFDDDASFLLSKFAARASFSGALFTQEADFEDAQFEDNVEFSGATLGNASFANAKFGGTAVFKGARFDRGTTFFRASFRKNADFEAIESNGSFSLTQARFQEVPNLLAADFKGPLRLDNVRTPRYRFLGWAANADAPARFRELRRRAAEASDHERELEFFAQELRTSRFVSRSFPLPSFWTWQFWFGLAYGALSNFGRSLWRPALVWTVLLLGFSAFYLGEQEGVRKARAEVGEGGVAQSLLAYAVTTRTALGNPPACKQNDRELFAATDAVTEAFQLSLRNALIFESARPEATKRTLGCLYGLEHAGDQEYPKVWPRVSMASTLQSLASGVLIFLFLLAVRNLLRLK